MGRRAVDYPPFSETKRIDRVTGVRSSVYFRNGETPVRILYIEDTLLNLCLIERIARMGAHEVINYAYAERALQNFVTDQPDLILVDLRLEGDMDGVDFIERLRAQECSKPIVVITAQAGDEIRERCMAAGATEFYNKPLMVRDMVRLIERYEPPSSQAEASTSPAPTAKVVQPPATSQSGDPAKPARPASFSESHDSAKPADTDQTAKPARPDPSTPCAETASSPASSGAAANRSQ